jgi:beta-glucosidase
LGDDVNFWLTLNEPDVNPSFGYLLGKWPPQRRSLIVYLRVTRNLAAAHNSAYKVIKGKFPNSKIGIAKHNAYFEAGDKNPVNRLLKFATDWWWNEYFLNRISKHQDFIGLNHHFHNRIDWGFNKNKNERISDMGWEIHPEAIYHVLKDLARYKKPIYITENGVADARDACREAFIRETLEWVKKAIGEGTDVRGYFHWSLLDNFEWADGFWPRFGLIAVDYKTLERKIRPSAFAYKKMIEEWGGNKA